MPNWTRNKLILIVPDDNKASLLASIEGPGDWWAPEDGHSFFSLKNETAPTQHLQMRLEKLLAAAPEVLRAAFRADPFNVACPTWMPISHYDILAWARRVTYEQQGDALTALGSVPFSVAKLLPWTGLDEFNKFFPGSIDENGWWVRDENAAGAYNSGRSGYIELRNNRIGVKWPPSEISMDKDRGQPREGIQSVGITFDTPWSPMSNPGRLLNDTLRTHGAKALLAWEEEDSNSGWFLLDPAQERNEQNTYEHGAFSVEEMDEDGEAYSSWDSDAFMERVLDDIDDPDFG